MIVAPFVVVSNFVTPLQLSVQAPPVRKVAFVSVPVESRILISVPQMLRGPNPFSLILDPEVVL